MINNKMFIDVIKVYFVAGAADFIGFDVSQVLLK